MLGKGVPSSKHLSGVADGLKECLEDLSSNEVFKGLSLGLQKELQKGKKFSLLSRADLNKMVGISDNYYAAVYKFVCTYIHTAPFAVSQMDMFRAGTPEAVRFYKTVIDYFTAYMAMAVREFLHFMPDQREGMPESVVKCVSIWEGVLTNWENPE